MEDQGNCGLYFRRDEQAIVQTDENMARTVIP